MSDPEIVSGIERSGFFDIASGAYDGDGIGCLLMPVFAAAGLLVHLVFRGLGAGWTLQVSVGDDVHRKVRYRTKSAAEADESVQRARALADYRLAHPE
ncbi:hypothetical protein [Kribbella sp. NPDC051770]|uniref:hypothetical protein n=1 Tax=Kribbella sp. NPDC051770 TaxID=3155413 RepID=UPI0034436A30